MAKRMSKLYGVFAGTKWGMTRNKRVAIRAARGENGEVREMINPETKTWDAPTFRVCSTRIWPPE